MFVNSDVSYWATQGVSQLMYRNYIKICNIFF